MAHKDIQSVLQEDRVFPPSAKFVRQATLKAAELKRMYDRAAADYVGFWRTSPLLKSRGIEPSRFRWMTRARPITAGSPMVS